MKERTIIEKPQSERSQAEQLTKPSLPEKEVLRRLWRIYEMALAAAQRTENDR